MLCSRAILGGRGSKSGDHEVVRRFMYVPVSEEAPQLSWHFRRHPRRTRGQRSRYPRDWSRNKGITPFSMPEHTSPPLGLLVGADVPSWCKYVRMGNGYPGQVGCLSRMELLMTPFPLGPHRLQRASPAPAPAFGEDGLPHHHL